MIPLTFVALTSGFLIALVITRYLVNRPKAQKKIFEAPEPHIQKRARANTLTL